MRESRWPVALRRPQLSFGRWPTKTIATWMIDLDLIQSVVFGRKYFNPFPWFARDWQHRIAVPLSINIWRCLFVNKKLCRHTRGCCLTMQCWYKVFDVSNNRHQSQLLPAANFNPYQTNITKKFFSVTIELCRWWLYLWNLTHFAAVILFYLQCNFMTFYHWQHYLECSMSTIRKNRTDGRNSIVRRIPRPTCASWIMLTSLAPSPMAAVVGQLLLFFISRTTCTHVIPKNM